MSVAQYELAALMLTKRPMTASGITTSYEVIQSRDIPRYTVHSRRLLDDATQFAIWESHRPLGTNWFNTENQIWWFPTLHKELAHQAVQQNVIIYQRPDLTVLAAPWEYAFSGKVFEAFDWNWTRS